jgi:hypothetical protein
MRAEIERLEKLQRLEARYCIAPPEQRPAIQTEIDTTMEEIASLGRMIQEYRIQSALEV